MATIKQIQAYVKSKHGFSPKTCWIAHGKEVYGLPLKKAWNRTGERTNPCPSDKIEYIKEAFEHFNML